MAKKFIKKIVRFFGHPTNEDELKEEINQRAYEIYKERGSQEGEALQDWLQAEREVGKKKKRKK